MLVRKIDPSHFSIKEIEDYYNQEVGVTGYEPGRIFMPMPMDQTQLQYLYEGRLFYTEHGHVDYYGRLRFVRVTIEKFKGVSRRNKVDLDPRKLAEFITA